MNPSLSQYNQGMQQGPPTWQTSGFNKFLERSPQSYLANELLDSFTSPFIEQISNNGYMFDPFADTTSQSIQSMMQPISASQIQGGTLQSSNGNLQMNLDQGTLTYTDGAQQLLNVGGISSNGTPNSVTINSQNGQPSTDTSLISPNATPLT